MEHRGTSHKITFLDVFGKMYHPSWGMGILFAFLVTASRTVLPNKEGAQAWSAPGLPGDTRIPMVHFLAEVGEVVCFLFVVFSTSSERG